MKLSAPPPPPPEPPEPGPGPEPAPDQPDPNAETADLVAPRTPGADGPAAPQPAPAARRPVAWPAWLAGVDGVLVLLALGLAFLAASFAARNSDVWLHLGTGRLLAEGGYTPGTDPLSYTAADRPWVNHSWLWDLGTYLLYAGDGGTLVFVKALAVAAAFGLLIAVRRPGQPLWPWAATAAVAVVAVAPRTTLNPIVGSMVLYALTLVVLFRVPARPGSWRVPLLIGGTFWLWANVDHWFVIGPLTVGVLLAAQGGAAALSAGGGPNPEPAADPLPLPDTETLARALLVGIVACMLNPHHYRVWQVPYELQVWSDNTYGDPRLIPMRYLPLSSLYWSEDGLGYNVNGLAYAALLLAGLYAAFLSGAVGQLLGRPFDLDPLPLPHAALWFGLAALSVLSLYAVPFLALATVPLVASRLNLFSARLEEGPNLALWLTGSVGGRLLTGAAVVALGVAAWPGWLHPPASNWAGAGGNPATARRVDWKVEPDPELAKAATWLQEQRAAGRLPADARGLLTGLDLANYCAWYAPAEKVFANARYNHHRAELPRFAAVRQGLGLVVKGDDRPDAEAARQVLTDYAVAYVGVGVPPGGSESISQAKRVGIGMLAEPAAWSPWYLDGRTTVSGWRGTAADPRPDADRLKLDPAALAFGPGVELLPPGQVTAAPPPRGALDAFWTAARPSPPAADEAVGWLAYQELTLGRERFLHEVRYLTAGGLLVTAPGGAPPVLAARLAAVGELRVRTGQAPPAPLPKDGSVLAAPVLAVRAARRAIADNPDHPDGYFALAQALADPNLPLADHEREVGRITALRQCLSRLPAPADYRPGYGITRPAVVCQQLAQLYLGPPIGPTDFRGIDVDLFGVREQVAELISGAVVGPTGQIVPEKVGSLSPDPGKREGLVFDRMSAWDADRFRGVKRGFTPLPRPSPYLLPLDLAADALTLAADYLTVEAGREPTPEAKAAMDGLEAVRKRLEVPLRRAVKLYNDEADRQPKPRQQYEAAKRNGLIRQALLILKDLGGDLGREFGPDAADVALQMTALELAVGRIEDAAADIAALKAEFPKLPGLVPKGPNRPDPPTILRLQEFQLLWLGGDYAAAGRVLEDVSAAAVAGFKADPPREAALGLVWPTGQTGFGVVTGPAFWMGVRAGQYQLGRQQVVAGLDLVAGFYRRRGLLALLEGDLANARDRFAQTRRPALPAWGLAEFTDPIADEYVRLIDAAAKKGK